MLTLANHLHVDPIVNAEKSINKLCVHVYRTTLAVRLDVDQSAHRVQTVAVTRLALT